MPRTVAVVLAGGRGRRTDILCYIRPKPGLFFAGWYRVIDFALSNCIYPEILNMAVLTDYERSHMAKHLKLWKQVNAPNRKLRILEAEAGSYKGTADAIYQNPDYLQNLDADTVLVSADDHVYKMGYRRMLTSQQKASADVTMGVVRVPMEQAHRFGTATLDGVGKIVSFAAKTWTPPSSLASTGIYALETEPLCQHLIEDAQQPDSPDDFSYAIIPRMVNRDSVFAYQLDGYWHDIDIIEAYCTANMESIGQTPPFSLDGLQPVLTQGSCSSATKEFQQVEVLNSTISSGCTVEGRMRSSVLSPGVRIDEQAEIRNSVLMPNVFVGYHSVVDGCIIGEGVNIGRLCHIGFGRSPVS